MNNSPMVSFSRCQKNWLYKLRWMRLFTPKCFCFLKEIPFWLCAIVLCRYFSALPSLLALTKNMPFFLLGVGLCLCFKLKRLKINKPWTSVWPTWVQVGSLIITFSPTSWCTFMVLCQPVPHVLMCLAGNERSRRKNPVYCNKTVVLHLEFAYFVYFPKP